MSKFKKIFYFFAGLIGIALLVLLFFFYLLFSPAAKGSDVKFVVQPGQGVNQISANLYEQGLIKNRLVFEIYVWFKGWEKNFIAGSYQINPENNIQQVAAQLISLTRAEERSLRFIEGWTISDMADYLQSEGVINNKEEFTDMAKAGLWQEEFNFLISLPEQQNLEGYLFPDTYKFFANATSSDIIRKMLINFDQKFSQEMRADLSTQGRSLPEAVILASILEKEVKTASDMNLVSDIFLKRLDIGMALQADSTLNYATGGSNPSLTAQELQIDSPYNTYKYTGLPPTAISNPGLNALKAAVYPEANDYFFFLTDAEGKAYFGETLKEHNQNRRYLP